MDNKENDRLNASIVAAFVRAGITDVPLSLTHPVSYSYVNALGDKVSEVLSVFRVDDSFVMLFDGMDSAKPGNGGVMLPDLSESDRQSVLRDILDTLARFRGENLADGPSVGLDRDREEIFAIESAVERLEQINADLYQADTDIRGAVCILLGDSHWDMAPDCTAENVIYTASLQLLGMVHEQDRQRLEGYGIDNIAGEAEMMTADVMSYVTNAAQVRFHGGEEMMGTALGELNRLNALLLEKGRREDPGFVLKDHVASYSVRDFGRYDYALVAADGTRTSYLTGKMSCQELTDRISDLAGQIRKEVGQEAAQAEERMKELHPDFTAEQRQCYTMGFIAGHASHGRVLDAGMVENSPRLTDVQVILPVSKEYYITAKVDGRQMLRMPISRQEAKAMAEGSLDVNRVAEQKYAQLLENFREKGKGLKI